MSSRRNLENSHNRRDGTEWVRTATGPWHNANYACKSRNDTVKIVFVKVRVHPPHPVCSHCRRRSAA